MYFQPEHFQNSAGPGVPPDFLDAIPEQQRMALPIPPAACCSPHEVRADSSQK